MQILRPLAKLTVKQLGVRFKIPGKDVACAMCQFHQIVVRASASNTTSSMQIQSAIVQSLTTSPPPQTGQ